MVKGIDQFKAHFVDFTDRYVLIGVLFKKRHPFFVNSIKKTRYITSKFCGSLICCSAVHNNGLAGWSEAEIPIYRGTKQ